MENWTQEKARRAAQRQLDAYNAHDIDAFVACYHSDVEVFDLKSGALQMRGREQMKDAYGAMFERFPDVYASVTNRSVVGNVAFDHERVSGRGDEMLQVMAIYEVDDAELIRRVWFVR